MSIAVAFLQSARGRLRYQGRRVLTKAGSVMLGLTLLIWSLLPIYNMLLIALDPEEGEIEFAGNIWPPEPSLSSFWDVVTQEARYLENFWQLFGNSLFIGSFTMVLTVLIGSPASFAVSRLWLSRGSLLTNVALGDPPVVRCARLAHKADQRSHDSDCQRPHDERGDRDAPQPAESPSVQPGETERRASTAK